MLIDVIFSEVFSVFAFLCVVGVISIKLLLDSGQLKGLPGKVRCSRGPSPSASPPSLHSGS